MALTDSAVRSAKARAKEYKLADNAGLYLLVTPSGGRLWRLKYRMDGRDRLRQLLAGMEEWRLSRRDGPGRAAQLGLVTALPIAAAILIRRRKSGRSPR